MICNLLCQALSTPMPTYEKRFQMGSNSLCEHPLAVFLSKVCIVSVKMQCLFMVLIVVSGELRGDGQ
jgi:hypothetical protein